MVFSTRNERFRKNRLRYLKKMSSEQLRIRVDEKRAALASVKAAQPEMARRKILFEQISGEITSLIERRQAIASAPTSRKSELRQLFSLTVYTKLAQRQLELLDKEIEAMRATLPRAHEFYQYDKAISGLTEELEDCEMALRVVVDNEVRLETQKKAKERQKLLIEELRMAAARTNSEMRDLAAATRRKMVKQGCCPYCGELLGDDPHADHIYPVCKGGRSVERNMVFVCPRCNMRKSSLTLAAFVKRYALDRDVIEERLAKMGKDY